MKSFSCSLQIRLLSCASRKPLHARGDRFRAFMIGYLLFRLAGRVHQAGVLRLSRRSVRPAVALHRRPAATTRATSRVSAALLVRKSADVGSQAEAVSVLRQRRVGLHASACARVEAKILIKDERVYLEKWCPQHGRERVLIADDAAYYRQCREVFIKPPELPRRFNTEQRWGCPYDCGLCPEHMQHSCLTLVEITDHCNLRCPICYADSGPHRPGFRDLATVERMLDAVVANEGEPDVVQISGGEPTLHPDFFAILDAAKASPDPAPDGQHQWPAHRTRTGFRGAAGRATSPASSSTCSSIRFATRSIANCAAPTCATYACARWKTSTARRVDHPRGHRQEGPQRR